MAKTVKTSKAHLSAQALGDAQADKRLEILQGVGRHGSISQAARAAGVSYKAAWQALHTLTNLAGEPLVDSSVGGVGGGGARITAAGERLLRAARLLEGARREVLARIDQPASVAAVAPRTSMRNHLRAQVIELLGRSRDPLLRVRLQLAGGGELGSLITRESAELLALAPGLALLVLAKATAVRVAPPGDVAAGVTETGLPGRVARCSRGSELDELTLTLDGGQQLVGFARRPHRLRAGSRAQAWVDERTVVLARVD